ncbi:kinesin heavy chain isoform X4 [Ictalurus furcatus]|uniref:kinesin heavy chain isoform X4 n=1 Tax=Ictalurus furcatus TaxID=66913 RepID=UPI0023500967|nr:kinesin heavy chain isoform X4 [Ictalurus furcatus]XP_053488648.1 kinesin heavy chain isoform X4 [Ictalurus furcatus]
MRPEDVHQMEQARNSKRFRVVLCLCPPERTEMRTGSETRASIRVIGTNRVTVDTGRGHRAHVLDFDAVWNEGASPKDIYESTTKSLVEYVMKGYNGCVVLYGQSTSGETHPVQACTARQRGIISRTADDIFNSPEASHCRVRVSSYHISNEKIYDLLEPQVSEVCRIHDTEEVVLLEGLRELEVGSAQELMDVYHSGIAHRNTGVSKGDFASKSHMVLNIMVINMRGKSDKEGVLTASKLTLVDLASSGKSTCNSSAVLDMRRSFHVAQENLQEAKTIKRSLTIFRNVIFSLSNTGSQHIPYRESKLTRVLRDCLGGNCRTCLMVTMPTQSSSVTETMSCLQFAAQALNIPSRPVHTSQIRYTPAQVQNMWTAEKNSLLLTRTQILPPVSGRSQTSLPSIVSSPGPLTQLKPRRSLEISENRCFLPHLEKPRLPEPSRYHSCSSRITEEKTGAVDVCVVKSAIPLSRCLSGSVFAEPLRRRSAEKPSSSLGSSSVPPPLLECSNCKQERKIREEYDKFIIQVKRDRDSLSQRVTELEKELKNRGGEQGENGRVEKDKRRAERDIGRHETATGSNETENGKKTEGEVRQMSREGDEREIGKDKIEIEGNDDRRQFRGTEQKEGEREEERERREEREGEKENDSTGKESISTSHGVTEAAKNTEESLLSELHSIRKEYEGLRKSAALSITQLHKEKAELLSHIDDTKSCYEKVCLENAELKARLEALLKEANSRPCSGCNGNTDTHGSHTHTNVHNSHMDTHSSHTHTVTTNTEMLVVSHSVCQECTSDLPQDKGSKCCFSSCSGFPESTEPPEPTSHTCRCEPTLHKPSLYKQLRREHSLLLDVMLVLYKREWFLQDAMPYVRRTLKKCGLTLEDSD